MVHENSRPGLDGGHTIQGTRVNLDPYGSTVADVRSNRNAEWIKSRFITLEGDPNEWFTIFNVASKRYFTATGGKGMEIQGQLC